MKKFLFVILLSLGFTAIANAQDFPDVKLTGTVTSDDGRLAASAIVDGKIWWEGQQFLIKNGKLEHPVTTGGPKVFVDTSIIYYNSKFNSADLAVLLKVESKKVYVLYRSAVYVLKCDTFHIVEDPEGTPVKVRTIFPVRRATEEEYKTPGEVESDGRD